MSRIPPARKQALIISAALGLPLLCAAFVYAPALGSFFAADDVTFLSRAAGLESQPAGDMRWLSNRVSWSVLYALFGLDPLPYHVMLLILHLAATAVLFSVAYRVLRSAPAAAGAAALFAVSMPAFTPLHWVSATGDLLCAVAGLGALFVVVGPAYRASRWRAWLSAALYALALSAKETGVLLVVPLLAAAWPAGAVSWRWRARQAAGAITPQLLIAFGSAIALWAALSQHRYLGGAAYATDLAPLSLLGRLLGYLRWAFDLRDSIPDQVAAVRSGVDAGSLAVAVVAMGFAVCLARRGRRIEWLGALWFLSLLAPVLPLRSHAYLYYLYVPWAGACLVLASLGSRLAARWPAPVIRALVATGLLAYLAVVGYHAGARERSDDHGLPLDRTMRDGTLIRNALAGLREAGVSAGDKIAFVNPYATVHRSLSAPSGRAAVPGEPITSYVPLAGALRDGETLALFAPGIHALGVADSIPAAWEGALLFTFMNEGTLTPLGRGAAAHQRLGLLQLELERWPQAEKSFRRALALGESSADAAYGLLHSLAGQGRTAEATRLVSAFVRQWPDDPRSGALREALASGVR